MLAGLNPLLAIRWQAWQTSILTTPGLPPCHVHSRHSPVRSSWRIICGPDLGNRPDPPLHLWLDIEAMARRFPSSVIGSVIPWWWWGAWLLLRIETAAGGEPASLRNGVLVIVEEPTALVGALTRWPRSHIKRAHLPYLGWSSWLRTTSISRTSAAGCFRLRLVACC